MQELRENPRYIAASVLGHLIVVGLAFLVPGFAPPHELTVPLIAPVVAGNGAAGSSGDAVGNEGSVAQTPAERMVEEAATPPPELPAPDIPAPPKPRPSKLKPQPTSKMADALPPPEPTPTPASPPRSEQLAAVPGPNVSITPRGATTTESTAAASKSGTGTTGVGQAAYGRGQGPGDDYFERLRRYLARYKRYPPDAVRRKQEGTVMVEFEIARDGTVVAAQIERSSGFPLLDRAVFDMLYKASPVPPLPDDFPADRGRIVMPIAFSIGFFDRLF
jgi:protein TonB